MTKQKTSPIFWAAFSILLLSSVMPGLGQSRAQNPDTLFNCTWTSATVYPITILDQATATVGSNLYAFGGVSTAITAAANKFDGTTWTAIAPLPVALEFPQAATDGTFIYILGGAEPSAGTPQTTNNRYDPVANTYTPMAPFTTGTWNHAAVFLGGKIYKFCGTGPGTASTSVTEIYDVASNTWTAGPAYPLAISFVSGWTNGTFIYGAGGIQSVGSVASAKTYRLDPANLGAGWVDAAIADLPATRWGAATAFYTDAVLAGGYVAGVATANISNTAISYDQASDTWQTLPNMVGERARMTGAVLNNHFYVIGGRSVASPGFVGTNSNQDLLCLNTPTNILSSAGFSISSAGPNGALDPGEVVTVTLGARNTGGPGVVCTTAATTGTLQVSGGVTSPSAPQNYGMLCSGSPAVHRSFTFTVDPALPCGSTVTASLVMTDGATNYGTLTYTFITGNLATSFTENFDGVVAPALPAGWVPTFSGTGAAPTTSTTFPDTAPNDVFFQEGANVGLSEVASPAIPIPAGPASTMSFRNLYNTEPGFDGLVLEIKIGAGAFQDILAAGGSFVSGGYNATLATGFQNPLPGRMAWAGLSGGTAAAPAYITSVVKLPAAASGQSIQLMWRLGSDNSVLPATNPGARIDTLRIFNAVCSAGAAPAGTAVSRKTHTGVGVFDIPLPQVPLTGAIGIEDRVAAPGVHQVVVTFPGPVTVGGAAITSGTGTATTSVAGGTVTIDITGAPDVQRLSIQLSNVSDGTNLGNVTIPMGLLLGDTGGNGNVGSSDIGQTKAAAASGVVNASTFRTDVNANGVINSSDIGTVKARSGAILP